MTFRAKICIFFSTVQSSHSFEQGGVTTVHKFRRSFIFVESTESARAGKPSSIEDYAVLKNCWWWCAKNQEKAGPKGTESTPVLFVFCVWLPHKYYCAEVHINRKIICLKLLWKTKSVDCLCHGKFVEALSYLEVLFAFWGQSQHNSAVWSLFSEATWKADQSLVQA